MIASRAGLAEGDPLQQIPFSQLRSSSRVQNILVIQIQRARFNLPLSRRIPFNVNISFKLLIPFSSNSPLSQLSPFVNFQSIQSALPAERSEAQNHACQYKKWTDIPFRQSIPSSGSIPLSAPSLHSAPPAKQNTEPSVSSARGAKHKTL